MDYKAYKKMKETPYVCLGEFLPNGRTYYAVSNHPKAIDRDAFEDRVSFGNTFEDLKIITDEILTEDNELELRDYLIGQLTRNKDEVEALFEHADSIPEDECESCVYIIEVS